MRAIVAAQNWMELSDGLNLTMSAGITDIRRDEAAEELFARADKALYLTKDSDRNCVVEA